MTTQTRHIVVGRPRFGPLVGVGLVLVYAVLWYAYRPASGIDLSYLGEILGVEAIVFMAAWSMAMVTLLPGMEDAYGGLDRQLVWHRRTAIVGTLLMVVHQQITFGGMRSGVGGNLSQLSFYGILALIVWALLGPTTRAARWRGPIGWLTRVRYDVWLPLHRILGLLLIAAMVHGLLQDRSLDRSTVLKISYLAVCALGVLTYLYRELLMRYFLPEFAHTVDLVERPTPTLLIVTLNPHRDPVRLVPGQYVYVHFGTEGWRPHPFTVAGTDELHRLRLAIQSTGDETAELHRTLQPGTPVRVFGPHGRFDYRRGGRRQIWIAAGVGVTPFQSWIQALDATFDREVDFFYTVADPETDPFAGDLVGATLAHSTVHLHLIASRREGRLTPDQVLAATAAPYDDVWVYMCGPLHMMRTFEKQLRQHGFPRRHIIWERFEIR
jgi:predicted ferric reductase